MEIKTALETSLKEALRAGDELRKRTIRQALAAIKQAEIDRRTALDEPAIQAILQKEIKTRRESIDEANKAGRPEMVADLEAEIGVLGEFLPQAMSSDELRPLVEAAIAETGASSPADMGNVMKAVMPRVAGRAPGDQVSRMVRELLQGQ
jgi:uncharacterized protein YqeY